MKKFTLDEAKHVAEEIGVDFEKLGCTLEEFRAGMDVELEHGTVDPQTDVTGDDPVITGKIALAHLKEFGTYYNEHIGLDVWEEASEEFEGDPAGHTVKIV